MLQPARLISRLLTALFILTLARAADAQTDFSGKWLLSAERSDLRVLPAESYPSLVIEQKADVHCTGTPAEGQPVQWTYRLDGEDSKYKIGAEARNSAAKWEGSALLTNTLVSGPEVYTIEDRWTLSHDGNQLNIRRQVSGGSGRKEGSLVYRREGAPEPAPATTAVAPAAALAPRPETPVAIPPASYTIPAGTHILLTLTNPLSTKSSKDGDHVYLETAVPVAQGGHIVIPRGSYVQGSINKSTPAGHGSAKGELYIRFDSLTLPNGVSRDFRARVSSADTTKGTVDSDEGKISGNGKGTDGGKVVRDVGIGSMGGVLIGSAAGHPVTGLGVGAAAGVAAVLLSKNQDIVLPRGTSVEMVLDRDLYYSVEELRH
jgi:type IV secretion system protein VirB10